jgi:hypothetical protein
MGLFLRFFLRSLPGRFHCAHDGLSAGMNVDVFDRNLLLAFATPGTRARS